MKWRVIVMITKESLNQMSEKEKKAFIIKEIFKTEKYELLILFDDVPEDLQLGIIEKKPFAIEFIKNPSEEVQLLAVKKNGCAIKFIKNPSEEIPYRFEPD